MHEIFAEFSDDARRAVAAEDWSSRSDPYPYTFLDFRGKADYFCPLGAALVVDARRLRCDRLFGGGDPPTCPTAGLVAGTLWLAEPRFRGASGGAGHDDPEYLRLRNAATDFMYTFDTIPPGERNAYVQRACGVAVLIEPAAAATPTRTGAAAQEVPA